MRRNLTWIACLGLMFCAGLNLATAQVKWVVGGRLGMSLYSISVGGGYTYNQFFQLVPVESTTETSAGLQIGPTAEVIFARQYAIVTEFNINTQAGTPIEWGNLFKMYFSIPGSKIKPYADAGFSLFFITGGPYFALRAGGGANFEIAPNLYIPADLTLGPVFLTGVTGFYMAITSGIRYYIPS